MPWGALTNPFLSTMIGGLRQQKAVPRPQPQFGWPDFNAPSPALDAYKSHLSAIPTPDQYNPNWWSKIGAAAAGASAGYFKGPQEGVNVARDINEYPYRSALENWNNKALGMKAAADIETDDLRNKFKLATDRQKAEQDWIEAENLREYREGQLGIGRERNEIDRQRLQQQGWIPHTFEFQGGTYDMLFKPGENPIFLGPSIREGRGERTEARQFNRGTAYGVAGINQSGADRRNQATIQGAADRQQAGFTHREQNPQLYGGGGQDRYWMPSQFQNAEDFVRNQMLADPALRNLFFQVYDIDEDTGIVTPKEGVSPQAWSDFQAARSEILKMMRQPVNR